MFYRVREGTLRPAASEETKSTVFAHVTRALVTAIRERALPHDLLYLQRLHRMEQRARAAIRRVEGHVTVIVPDEYVDPLALYRAVETDLVVITRTLPDGKTRYTLGVHPRAYGRIDLGPTLARLNAREPGWGGRANAAGSPLTSGSRLPIEEAVALFNECA